MSDFCVGHLKDFPGTHLFFHRSKSINGAYFALWIETGKMFSHGNRPGIDKMSDIQSEKKLWARGKRNVGRACKGNLGTRQRELQNYIPSSECRVSLRTCGCRRPATPRLEGNSSGEKRLQYGHQRHQRRARRVPDAGRRGGPHRAQHCITQGSVRESDDHTFFVIQKVGLSRMFQ